MDPSDAEVIARSLGDPEAFGVIFDRHYDTIHRYVARRSGPDSASDLAADVFTRAFVIRHRYDPGRESALPWLYGIAVNIIGDALRRLRRSERLYLALAGEELLPESAGIEQVPSRVAAAEAGRAINQALGRLAPRDRETIILYAIEQLTYSQIAEALGIPIGTVRSRLARARSILRELLAPLIQSDDED